MWWQHPCAETRHQWALEYRRSPRSHFSWKQDCSLSATSTLSWFKVKKYAWIEFVQDQIYSPVLHAFSGLAASYSHLLHLNPMFGKTRLLSSTLTTSESMLSPAAIWQALMPYKAAKQRDHSTFCTQHKTFSTCNAMFRPRANTTHSNSGENIQDLIRSTAKLVNAWISCGGIHTAKDGGEWKWCFVWKARALRSYFLSTCSKSRRPR